jgi:DNA-binding response OmpR family regulator
MTILVADDDPVLTRVLSTRLKKSGYQVVVVYDAMQAIKTALRILPAAILLDVNMPGGTGTQVLRQLKNSLKTNQIPIIVITASADPGTAKTVVDLGADRLMTKPPDFDRLECTLRELLGSPADSSAREAIQAAPPSGA